MTIYYVLYFLIALITLVSYASAMKANYKRMVCTWSVFILLLLVLGLRHETMGKDLVGYTLGDKVGYLVTYDKIADATWSQVFHDTFVNYERGYIIYCKIVATLTGGDHQIFLAVTALASLLPIAWCIYRKSETPTLSWLIYMGLPMLTLLYSGLRQSIALGLCALSVLAIQDRKPLRFALLVLLAATFHRSALVFLVAFPIYFIRFNTAMRALSMLVIALVFIGRSFIFGLLTKLVRGSAVADNNNSITLFLVLLAIYLFCIVFSNGSEKQNGLMNIFLMACLCQAFGGLYLLALRIGYYFLLALVLLLPDVIRNLRVRQDRIMVTLAVSACFGFYGIYSIATSTWAEANPYHFFFETVFGV